jgi:AbiJ N-terminal domain 4
MAVSDIFSKRQRRARGEFTDVYVYDKIPNTLRVQIVQIIVDAMGRNRSSTSPVVTQVYEDIHKVLCREYGVFSLTDAEYGVNGQPISAGDRIFAFFLREDSTEKAIDVIELFFRFISDIPENKVFISNSHRRTDPSDAINELNSRLKEHSVGYQFESNEIIKVDSEFLHSEIVKPVLKLLHSEAFNGANEEFLLAHEHYRHSRYKECLVDALKAFESTIKTICKIRKWTFQPTDTAKNLIKICFDQGLLPPFLESQMASLRSLLESGVPTVRNKLGGHGQGPDPTTVPEFYARYALNLTATSVLFLMEAHLAKK